jgi:hypothetical protein
MGRAIEPPELFRAWDIYSDLGPGANLGQIYAELTYLSSVRAIAAAPVMADAVHYQRLDVPLWPFVAWLAEHTVELSSPPTSDAQYRPERL